MESESWSNLVSSSSRRLRSRSEKYSDAVDGGADAEEHQEARVEYTCPYCAEDFDMVGLYCHMDEEHPVAVKTGVCPVCTKKVGHEIVAHITMQHGNLFKQHAQRKRRHRKGGFSSTFSALRNEFREGHLHSHHGGSSRTSFPEPDLLLSSFVFRPAVNAAKNAELGSKSCEKPLERDAQKSSMPKEREQQDQKCEFVQQLMLSIILNDDL